MKRILIQIALLGASNVFAQNHTVIGEVNSYSLVELNEKKGVWDGDSYIIEPEFDEILGDPEGILFLAYRETALFLFTANGPVPVKEELIAVKRDDDSGWLLFSPKFVGHLDNELRIIPPVFERIYVEPETFFECCYNITVTKNGKKGLYVNGKEILPAEFEKIEEDDFDHAFERPVILVTRDKKKGLFLGDVYHKPEGEMVLKPEFDQIKYITDKLEDGHLFEVKKNNLTGLFGGRDSLHMFLPPMYKSIDLTTLYDFGLLMSVKVKSDEGSHKILFSPNIPGFKPLYLAGTNASEEGFIFKDVKGKYGVLVANPEISIIPAEYDLIEPFEDFSFAVKKVGKWGIMNLKGELTTEISHPSIPNHLKEE